LQPVSLTQFPFFDSLPDPGPLPALRTARIEADLAASSRRPVGDAFLKLNHFFELHMRAVIEEVLDVARTIQHFWQFSHIYRIISKQPTSQQLGGRLLKQECCRIALIMWLSYIYSVGTTGVPSLPVNV
jgi:hypothetical protein